MISLSVQIPGARMVPDLKIIYNSFNPLLPAAEVMLARIVILNLGSSCKKYLMRTCTNECIPAGEHRAEFTPTASRERNPPQRMAIT